MLKDGIISFYYKTNYQEELLSILINELISCKATIQDNRINNSLLTELVINYSSTEKQLYELNKLKSKFLGMAAHDLRNPLTSIIGFSDLILSDPEHLNDEHQEYIKIINETGKKMLDLLNELLDITAIESGKFTINYGLFSMQEIIKRSIMLNNTLANKKNLKFYENFAELPAFYFDADKISQVLDNLITNAIKFSYPDKSIYIILEEEDGLAKVTVRDQGQGIPENEVSKLFSEYQKLSVRPTGGEKSTGLGLAIVKKLINAHQGFLKVESEVGIGSSFSFLLPIKLTIN